MATCSRCKDAMRLAERRKERRGFGPFGHYYVLVYQCDGCRHRTYPRVSKTKWDKSRVQTFENQP
jgi:hypothetical protein